MVTTIRRAKARERDGLKEQRRSQGRDRRHRQGQEVAKGSEEVSSSETDDAMSHGATASVQCNGADPGDGGVDPKLAGEYAGVPACDEGSASRRARQDSGHPK